MNIIYRPIGFFKSPHMDVRGMPIQPTGARGTYGAITILKEYREGLADLDGFSHVFVLYHLHEICGHELTVTPFLDTTSRGIFATRSPNRPNPLGLSVMELVRVTEDTVLVNNVDVLNGTPVLDIKPYVPDFDVWPADRTGWFQGKSGNASHRRSDDRFARQPEECIVE